jgi:acyl carrier protein
MVDDRRSGNVTDARRGRLSYEGKSMTRAEEIINVVRQYVDDIGNNTDKLVLDAGLRDLGIDSLHAVELLFRLEERFEVDLPIEDFPVNATLREAVAFIESLLPAGDSMQPR